MIILSKHQETLTFTGNQILLISNNISTPKRLLYNKKENKYFFLFYHGNKLELIVFLYRRVILIKKKCRESCLPVASS